MPYFISSFSFSSFLPVFFQPIHRPRLYFFLLSLPSSCNLPHLLSRFNLYFGCRKAHTVPVLTRTYTWRVLFVGIIWSGWNMRWAPDSGLRWRSGGRCWWRCSWYTVLRSPLVVMVLVEATFYPPRSAFNGTPSIFRNATRGPLRYSLLRTCNNLLKTLYTISLHIRSSCRTSFYGT